MLALRTAPSLARWAAPATHAVRWRSELTNAEKVQMKADTEFAAMSDSRMVRRTLAAMKRGGQRHRKRFMLRKREHVTLNERDLWPVSKQSVAYCPNPKDADALIGAAILDQEPLIDHVGFRTERRANMLSLQRRWRKSAQRMEQFKQNPIAVISISTDKVTLVLHVAQWGLPTDWCNDEVMPCLHRLLSSNRVAKVCSNASAVARGVYLEYGCPVQNFVDIGTLAAGLMTEAQCNGVAFQPLGFSFPALAHTFNPTFPLATRMYLSNWHALPLAPAQMVFTSNMASSMVHIYAKLIAVREKTRASPLGPWHHVYVVINSWTLRFPQQEPPDLPALREGFLQGSDFYETVRRTVRASFRDFNIKAFWFACTRQTVCVAFETPEEVDDAITTFAGHKSFIVTNRPVEWKVAVEEFRLRMGGKKKPLPSEEAHMEDDKWVEE